MCALFTHTRACAAAAPERNRSRLWYCTCVRARVVEQAYDVRHPKGETVTADGVHLHGCDLTAPDALDAIVASHAGRTVAFAMAYPPCTDLSRAGARYWKAKAAARPSFQTDATALVRDVDAALRRLNCTYFIENPGITARTSNPMASSPPHARC
jgi:hypothetical protein